MVAQMVIYGRRWSMPPVGLRKINKTEKEEITQKQDPGLGGPFKASGESVCSTNTPARPL